MIETAAWLLLTGVFALVFAVLAVLFLDRRI